MKKLLAIVLAVLMLLSLAACKNDENQEEVNGTPTEEQNESKEKDYSKATVIDKDDNVVEITAKELCDLYSSNTAKFNKLYQWASITFIGKIKSINLYSNNLHTYYEILISNGWELHVAEHSELGETIYQLDVGDTVEVTTKIQSAFGSTVTVYDTYSDYPNSGYHDRTTITVVEK